MERADLLLGGEHELAELVGGPGGRELAERCRELGPREVVLKRGAGGAAALDARRPGSSIGPPPSPDLDPVGAGDAFNAGYLAARLSGASIEEALEQGARSGADVASAVGDTGSFEGTDADREEGSMTRDARQPPDVPRPRAAYSPVVVAGPLVFTAGQVAFGPDDTLVSGGIEEQTRQVLDNVERCLASAGCAMDDVVKVTAFLNDLADFEAYDRVYETAVRGAVPGALDRGSAARRRAPRRDRGRRAAPAGPLRRRA